MLRKYARRGWLRIKWNAKRRYDAARQMEVRANNIWQMARELSGGNQQKVVLAKWLSTKPRILILDEPTRGIDVGTKAAVHALMSKLAAEGMAILMISSELPEVLGMSDRIIVMREGSHDRPFHPRRSHTGKDYLSCHTSSGNQEVHQ